MQTITQIATEYDKSKQAAMVWRSKAEEKYGELPFTLKGKAKLYAAPEIEKILEYAPKQSSEVVEAELVDVAPSGGILAAVKPQQNDSSVAAISTAATPQHQIELARNSLESRQNFNTALSNLVQVVQASGGVGEQLGDVIGDAVLNGVRNRAAQRIAEGTQGIMAEFGLQPQAPAPTPAPAEAPAKK